MNSAFTIKLADDTERAARLLEQSSDYRVLRRVPHIGEIWCRSMPPPEPRDRFKIAIVDTETTSLSPVDGQMIEIAIVVMTISKSAGDLLAISEPCWWLEQPSKPLTEEIAEITGLSDELLNGQRFDDAAITETLADCQVIVAHNAAFDCRFFTQRFPEIALPWACSYKEINWSEVLPLASSHRVAALLNAAGMFSVTSHRAGPDAWSTAVLMSLAAPDGRTLASDLITRARRTSVRLFAMRAPIASKDVLKAAGYHWSPTRKAWWIESDEERIANEEAWLASVSPLIRPERINIDWHNRHTGDPGAPVTCGNRAR